MVAALLPVLSRTETEPWAGDWRKRERESPGRVDRFPWPGPPGIGRLRIRCLPAAQRICFVGPFAAAAEQPASQEASARARVPTVRPRGQVRTPVRVRI